MLIHALWRIGYDFDVRWRVLVWAAVLIAAAAAVALVVVAATAGLTAASGLAGVIVGLCELVAVALAVIGWAGRRRPSAAAGEEGTSTSAPSAGQPDPGQGLAAGRSSGKYTVSLGDNAQGVMIGDGNVQNIARYSRSDRAEPEAGESE